MSRIDHQEYSSDDVDQTNVLELPACIIFWMNLRVRHHFFDLK